MDTSPGTLRLDIWLWRARFFRTRALAGAQIRSRGVRVSRAGQTRRVDKPGTAIAVGDVVTFSQGAHIRSVEVLAFGTRRGPPAEAAALYASVETET